MAIKRFKPEGTVIETDKGTYTYGAINKDKGTQKQHFKPKPKAPPVVPVTPVAPVAPVQPPLPKKSDYNSSKEYGIAIKEAEKAANASKSIPSTSTNIAGIDDESWSAYRKKGYFYNKGSNSWTDVTGREIDPVTGKTPVDTGDQAIPTVEGQSFDNMDDYLKWVADAPKRKLEADFQNKKEQSAKDYANGVTQTDELAKYTTYDEYRSAQSQYQQDLISQEQGNVDAANAIEDTEFNINKKKSESAVEGVKASMAQGRENVMGSSKPLVAQGFEQRTQEAMGASLARLTLAQDQRDQAMAAMKKAAEQGDTAASEAYAGQIEAAKEQILKEELQQASLAQSAADTAASWAKVTQTKTETLQSSFEAMGERAADLKPFELASMADEAGLTIGQVTAMQQTAVLTDELERLTTQGNIDKNAKDIQQTQALIDKYAAELPTVGKTAQIQEWEFYSSLSDTDQEKFKELKRANPNFQYQEMDDGRWLQTDPTGKTPPKVVYTPEGEGEGEGFRGAWGTVNDALSVPDGIPIDPTTGEPAIDSWNGKTGSIQCAQFVNRYTGLTMGDDYDSKINAIQSISVDSPQVGDIFVSPYGDNVGHAGFIIGVSADGKTVTVKDANYVESGQIGTHDMSTDGMKFGRPSGGTNPEEAYPDFWEGLTPKEQVAFSALSSDDQSNIKQLLNGDVLLADLMASRGMEGSKARQKILQQAQSVDPGFSENTNKIRYEFRKKWDSTESSVGKNKLSINTALGHLADVKKMTQNLTPDNIQELNKLSNWWSAESGNTDIVNLQFGLEQLATEIAAVWKGTGAAPSESEIENQKRLLGLQFSEQQFEGILNTASEFLSSKITAARYSYKSTMGKEYAQTIIDPEKKQALIDAGIDPDSIIKENVPMTPEEKQQQADLELYNKSVEDSKYVPDSIDLIKW